MGVDSTKDVPLVTVINVNIIIKLLHTRNLQNEKFKIPKLGFILKPVAKWLVFIDRFII